MKKYISFGEYNKLYNQIWLYVFTKYIYGYALGNFLETKVNDFIYFPKDILIQQAFNYFISFMGSIFLFFYKKNYSINVQELIKNNLLEDKNLSISDYFIILLLFLCIQINKAFFVFCLKGLDFWTFEILFIALINSKLFDIPIYKHKKLGIIIIIIICSLFKILSTIYRFIDDDNPKLYTFYHVLIPIGIIFYLLIILLRSYAYCKIKCLCDTKYILPSKILILYNLLGAFLCFIASIISHFSPCIETYNIKDINNFLNKVCQVKENKDLKVLYYDNYSIYFKIFSKSILISIIIFVLKTTFCFFNKIFTIYIIKNLSPECIICSNSIYHFITEIIDLLYFLIFSIKKNNFKFYKFYHMIAEIFCFFGSLIYLELIEIHFCQMDYNIRKNIKIRAENDINNEGLIDDENSPFEKYEKNENEFRAYTTQELIKTLN